MGSLCRPKGTLVSHRWKYVADQGEFAHASAMAVAAINRAPDSTPRRAKSWNEAVKRLDVADGEGFTSFRLVRLNRFAPNPTSLETGRPSRQEFFVGSGTQRTRDDESESQGNIREEDARERIGGGTSCLMPLNHGEKVEGKRRECRKSAAQTNSQRREQSG